MSLRPLDLKIKKKSKRSLFLFSIEQWHRGASLLESVCIVFFFKILFPTHKLIYCLVNKHLRFKANLQIYITEEKAWVYWQGTAFCLHGSSGGGKLFLVFDIWPITFATFWGNEGMVKWEPRKVKKSKSSCIFFPFVFYSFFLVKIGNWFVLIKTISVYKDTAIILKKMILTFLFVNSFQLDIYMKNSHNWLHFSIKVKFYIITHILGVSVIRYFVALYSFGGPFCEWRQDRCWLNMSKSSYKMKISNTEYCFMKWYVSSQGQCLSKC